MPLPRTVTLRMAVGGPLWLRSELAPLICVQQCAVTITLAVAMQTPGCPASCCCCCNCTNERKRLVFVCAAWLASIVTSKHLNEKHGLCYHEAYHAGNVKVTTYEEATRDTFAEAGRPVCDLRIYPAGQELLATSMLAFCNSVHGLCSRNVHCVAGVQYLNLPIEQVSRVTSAHISQDTASPGDGSADQPDASLKLDNDLLQLQQSIDGVQLLVCCHGSRDTRCGKLGNELVTQLNELIHRKQLQSKVEVLKCSHVGGHKVKQLCDYCVQCKICYSGAQTTELNTCVQYAGNVLVYGAVSPCDGDWFGGVNKFNAAEFLDAVINAEVCGPSLHDVAVVLAAL